MKFSFLILFFVLLLWGALILFLPADDGIFHVVLDPGHGGDDPGAVVGEVMEKDINLTVALLVQELLSEHEGVLVSMTRDRDVFLSLSDRAKLANKKQADLYVSIHANALENDDTFAGIFTFYHPQKVFSKSEAQLIQDAVSAASGGIDRGIRSDNFAVLRETTMPAVLVETGFMTCPEELELLLDPNYQILLAQGITQGILACREK